MTWQGKTYLDSDAAEKKVLWENQLAVLYHERYRHAVDIFGDFYLVRRYDMDTGATIEILKE